MSALTKNVLFIKIKTYKEVGNNLEIECLDIQPFYKNLFNEAFQDSEIKRQREFVRNFFEEWCGNFLHPFANEFFHQGKKASLLYCYLAAQSLRFDWLAHTLMLANYQIVLRELQAILENSFFVYSIDTTYGSERIEENLKKIEEIEAKGDVSVGKAIFEKSGYPYWQQGYELYKLLSKYEHAYTNSSVKMAVELAKDGYPEVLEVKYSRESFIQCSEVWQKVAQFLVALALDSGTKLGLKFRELDSDTLFKKL